MSPKAPPMNQQCEIVSVSRNVGGDYIEDDKRVSKCHLRYITTVRRTSNGEETQSDAMLWLPIETQVDSGDIVLCDGTRFQVDRINRARDLDTPIVHFLKCELEIIRTVSNV